MKIRIYLLSLLFVISAVTKGQVRNPFSGDLSKFRDELVNFMGPNLNLTQQAELNMFTVSLDSALIPIEELTIIADISSRFVRKSMRPTPHFTNLITTINIIRSPENPRADLTVFLKSLRSLLERDNYIVSRIDQFVKSAGSVVKEQYLYESGSVRWKWKGPKATMGADTSLYLKFSGGTLTCYSQGDSTELYDAAGMFYPDIMEFRVNKAKTTWVKAGYPATDVYAIGENFKIDITRSSFSCDSATLYHSTYFDEPVLGKLSDMAVKIISPDKSTFPKFETYIKQFKLNDIYKGVNYEGGISLDGAVVNGTGELHSPAKIELFRNDTLYMKISSPSFKLSKSVIGSSDVRATLLLGQDSIFHSNIGFNYYVDKREVNLVRTNSPVSRSPYLSSYHNVDLYFETLVWNMNSSNILMTRARGASMGQAMFESASFFSNNTFHRLMGMDDYHPLYSLVEFSKYYYSESFPINEYARWLKKPEETVTGMCIELTNKGFLHFDRALNEVTIKEKVYDYIAAYSKRKDYDVLTIYSETSSPEDNASLDMNTYKLTINGVNGVHLSDSQNVSLYPYGKKLVLNKNRNLEFDGVVVAGLFTIFGHDFSFNYDTFRIDLHKVDSIKIAVETERFDNLGVPIVENVNNLIQLTSAQLFIDDPLNKSGLRSLKQYPIINALSHSYIFFDKIPGMEGIYKQEEFYFKIDPFSYENIDHYNYLNMNLAGEFVGGKILKPFRHNLIIMADNSLGFILNTGDKGVAIYEDKGIFNNRISLDNAGLVGDGTIRHLSAVAESSKHMFYPDSLITTASTFRITDDGSGLYPDLLSKETPIAWYPWTDEWIAKSVKDKSFAMFGNGTLLDGELVLRTGKLSGEGTINMSDSRIVSNGFSFASTRINADTAEYNLKSLRGSGYGFIADNAKTTIDFDAKESRFSLNDKRSFVKFPELEYICKMSDFLFDMETKILSMENGTRLSEKLTGIDVLLSINLNNLEEPTFFSTNNQKDTLTFASGSAKYNLKDDYLVADKVNYINVADALIQPGDGSVTIGRRGVIRPISNAFVAVNNKHLIHSATISVESKRIYSGRGVYDYRYNEAETQPVVLTTIKVDTMVTKASGTIAKADGFRLNDGFTYSGDFSLTARSPLLTFTGTAGINTDCSYLENPGIKFKSEIDPVRVMIPVSDKPRDGDDNLVFNGSYVAIDSAHVYPAFFTGRKSWSDALLVSAQGYVWYDAEKGSYILTSKEKLANPTLHGGKITFDKNLCLIESEGPVNTGANFDLLKMATAGKVIHNIDSSYAEFNGIMAFDFHFTNEGLALMASDISTVPSLKPVALGGDLYNKALKDILGVNAARALNEELSLYGTTTSLPKEYTFELLLNDVTLYWNAPTSSFRSKGKIGIGMIGNKPMNIYLDGYIEVQRKRSGDLLDIYLKADNNTWYYFSYFRGVLMSLSSNSNYNLLLNDIKPNQRKHPDSNTNMPYSYMIGISGRMESFLRRMTQQESLEEPPIIN